MKNHHHAGEHWAIWWGISFGLAFLAAAAISFSMSNKQPAAEGPEYAISSGR
jgi:hypothetical protein